MSSLQHSPCVEALLEVDAEIMSHPLGFVIDAGGSLTKLVYRSKEDYKGGKQLKAAAHGILRLKSFTIDQLPGLADYIKTHVDICLGDEHKDVVWWQTGITSKYFMAQLEKELNIKTKLYSEMASLTNGLKHHHLTTSNFHHTFVENIAEASKQAIKFLEMMTQWQKMGEDMDFLSPEEGSSEKASTNNELPLSFLPPDHCLMQLIGSQDYQAWIEKHLPMPSSIETPSLFVLAGSACVVGTLCENYKFKFIDSSSASGKTLCALAEEVLGEKDFTKFIQLAEEGDSRKVDVSTSDLRQAGFAEDWYSAMPDDIVVFELGKLSSNNVKGRSTEHSKADLAAGLLSLQLHHISKMLISCARITKVSNIYVSGSMFQFPHVRRVFERHFYTESILLSVEHGKPFKLHFLDKPGYLVALGVWMKNIEEEEDRKAVQGVADL